MRTRPQARPCTTTLPKHDRNTTERPTTFAGPRPIFPLAIRQGHTAGRSGGPRVSAYVNHTTEEGIDAPTLDVTLYPSRHRAAGRRRLRLCRTGICHATARALCVGPPGEQRRNWTDGDRLSARQLCGHPSDGLA